MAAGGIVNPARLNDEWTPIDTNLTISFGLFVDGENFLP
jgi:hypothetical protein